MKDFLSISEFNSFQVFKSFSNFPVFLQIVCVAFSWVFIFFTVDAWFSPFYFTGYQLISYILSVLVLASILAHHSIYRLIKSSSLWNSSKSEKSALRSYELSIKDICDLELSGLAKNTAESVINYWSDKSNNNEEFIKEIYSQIEDIFSSLSEKLSKIKVEYFIKNLVLLVHNHLRSYKKTVNLCNNLSGSHSKFVFNHPVNRGEISLELYLDSLSRAVMKEFIPGSVQDCSAVFDFCCATFCNHVVNLVEHLCSPTLVLQALLEILQSIQENSKEYSTDSTDSTNLKTCENSIQEIPDISEKTEDPLSGSSPRIKRNEKETGNNADNSKSPFSSPRKSASPVLAGSNLSCNSLTSSDIHVSNSSLWVASAGTGSLVPSQFVRSSEDEDKRDEEKKRCKPDSLPLIGVTDIGSLDPMGVFSVDADVSPVYEVIVN